VTTLDLTIVIPTYNRIDYLQMMLNSIDFSKYVCRVIVIDNGNHIKQEVKNRYPGVIFYSYDTLAGMFENWNRGIQKVQTQWFMIPSDDDLFMPSSLSAIAKAIESYKDAGIISFGYNLINETGAITGCWKPAKTEIHDAPFGFNVFKYGVDARFPGIVFKTELVKQAGMFNESFKYTAADSLLIQKCLLLSKSIFIDEIIASYRVWSQNYTNQYAASTNWLLEIEQWQKEITIMSQSEFEKRSIHINPRQIADEVLARNILNSLNVLKRQQASFKKKVSIFKGVGYPFNAKLITQLKIVKRLILS